MSIYRWKIKEFGNLKFDDDFTGPVWLAKNNMRDNSNRTVGRANVAVAVEIPRNSLDYSRDQRSHTFLHNSCCLWNPISDYAQKCERACPIRQVFIV